MEETQLVVVDVTNIKEENNDNDHTLDYVELKKVPMIQTYFENHEKSLHRPPHTHSW